MASCTQLAIALLVLCASAGAQTAAPAAPRQPPPLTALFNRNLIFLDPAHGGADSGAHLTSQLLEKDVTLALALRLRDVLVARGFTVVLSRQSDAPDSPGNDDRAAVANHLRPVACILLHATAATRGVNLYAATLSPPADAPSFLPWDSAQASWVPQSLRLANELGAALARSHTPVLIHRADPKPLDSLTCPAVALELAPLPVDGASPIAVNDPSYQQRVADSLASALIFWKFHADPAPDSSAPSAGQASTAPEPAPAGQSGPNPRPASLLFAAPPASILRRIPEAAR